MLALQGYAAAAERHHGVALYEVDAEAGLHPDAPKPDDIKVTSLEGHAYWLRPTPVFSGGVEGVRIEEKCDRAQVWLRLDRSSRAALRNYTADHAGPTLAIVLDDQVIDPVARIMSTIDAAEIPVPEMDRAGARFLLQVFERDETAPSPG
jgi:preprotein translocase subunit SecD